MCIWCGGGPHDTQTQVHCMQGYDDDDDDMMMMMMKMMMVTIMMMLI